MKDLVSAGKIHLPAGVPFLSSWARACYARHTPPGVLASRGERLHSSTAGGLRQYDPFSSRPGAPVFRMPPGPLSCLVPSAPGSVAAAAGANEVAVTLEAQGNGSTITAYVVREASGPDVGASIATDGNATTAVLSELAGGAGATFSVVAESSYGSGPPGASSAVTPSGLSSTYLGSVLANTLSALYWLDELSGTVMPDSSGNQTDRSYSGLQTPGQAAPLASDPALSSFSAVCCREIGSANPPWPRVDFAYQSVDLGLLLVGA